MQFHTKPTTYSKLTVDLLVEFVSSEDWEKELTDLNKTFNNQLLVYLKSERYEAKENTVQIIPSVGQSSFKTLVIASIGKKTELSLNSVRIAVAQAAKYAQTTHKKSIAFDLNTTLFGQLNLQDGAYVVVEGAVLGAYEFSKYKSETKKNFHEIEDIYFLVPASKIQHIANGIELGELMVKGTIFARDLINESPTITTPIFLAAAAKSLAKREEVQVEIFTESEARRMGMLAFLAVSRGSDEPAKFIKLTYKGTGKKKIVLAGKAITFDTGGLSLKDAKNMETMKLDMSGAAAVLGIFKVLPQLKPKATVIGLIAACENMPGAKATKPGDIVTALNGTSIEILNTDAEGRLTLADVLSYAVKEKPTAIIDLATLTGACMVALGEDIAGLFSNNVELKESLLIASRVVGEKMWELPLEKDYKDQIKSDIADLRNIGKGRYGGAITAALFLEEFVDNIPWVHLDIAGPAFAEKDSPLISKGGAGYGVRTILQYLRSL